MMKTPDVREPEAGDFCHFCDASAVIVVDDYPLCPVHTIYVEEQDEDDYGE